MNYGRGQESHQVSLAYIWNYRRVKAVSNASYKIGGYIGCSAKLRICLHILYFYINKAFT